MARQPDCDCCAGVDADTPRRIANPPSLPAIDYRIGRHADFLDSLRARLSSAEYPALAALTSRESSDFTLALGDALACSLDVLGFYTERYAQEHYLRTATEQLSVRQMARLIGYRPAPGVAASTHLAFTLQSAPGLPVEPIVIPVGTKVQSVPGQGEQRLTHRVGHRLRVGAITGTRTGLSDVVEHQRDIQGVERAQLAAIQWRVPVQLVGPGRHRAW